MSEKFVVPRLDPDEMWKQYLRYGRQAPLQDSLTYRVFSLISASFNLIPSNPRCESCKRPFDGIGGSFFKAFGYRRSNMNPRYCRACDDLMTRIPGGAEVELTMLFADVRGSTAIAEKMEPAAYARLLNRFYEVTTNVLAETEALIDKLVGDEVIGLYIPGFAGPDHARRAIEAAEHLLEVTGHRDPEGPWIPVGAGVHTGVAYVGLVGHKDGVNDLTALGDAVNVTARLASKATQGEVIVSDAALKAAQVDTASLEHRLLDLKGKSVGVDAHVIRVAPSQDHGTVS